MYMYSQYNTKAQTEIETAHTLQTEKIDEMKQSIKNIWQCCSPTGTTLQLFYITVCCFKQTLIPAPLRIFYNTSSLGFELFSGTKLQLQTGFGFGCDQM